jgi:hypothetical protein
VFVVLRIKHPHAADAIALADKPGDFMPVRMRAPCSRASSILAAVRRNGSTVPSGTFTAPSSAGLTGAAPAPGPWRPECPRQCRR